METKEKIDGIERIAPEIPPLGAHWTGGTGYLAPARKTQCISSSFLVFLEFVHNIELEGLTVLAERKQLVGPGDVLAEGPYFAGENTYREGSKIFASRVGMADVIGNKLIVMPVKGAYIPRMDDIVLGRVFDIGMSGWQVDIYAPYPAMLPASETPMHRGRDSVRHDLRSIYGVGDLMIAQVIAFDRTRDPLLTTKGRGLGKVNSGRVARINNTKIPRVIGKKGSMITMLKKETGTDIIPGQNGVILVTGRNPDQELIAVDAIYMIEREAHTTGLTDRVKAMILERMKGITVGQ